MAKRIGFYNFGSKPERVKKTTSIGHSSRSTPKNKHKKRSFSRSAKRSPKTSEKFWEVRRVAGTPWISVRGIAAP